MSGFRAGLGGGAQAVHGQDQRMPAPTVSAMAASVATTQVKRARFAFTMTPSESASVRSGTGSRAVSGEIPGFASPPRDVFALDSA